ncbi:MAG: hypothetical protein KA314_16405 [Chloroflexi bacterium]|nr:hypothetical protein [Chloroflexota bacterium]
MRVDQWYNFWKAERFHPSPFTLHHSPFTVFEPRINGTRMNRGVDVAAAYSPLSHSPLAIDHLPFAFRGRVPPSPRSPFTIHHSLPPHSPAPPQLC